MKKVIKLDRCSGCKKIQVNRGYLCMQCIKENMKMIDQHLLSLKNNNNEKVIYNCRCVVENLSILKDEKDNLIR